MLYPRWNRNGLKKMINTKQNIIYNVVEVKVNEIFKQQTNGI